MKFSIFADLHHFPGAFMGGTEEDLDFIRDRAVKAGCAFVIHAGDFCHRPLEAQSYIARYNAFPIPAYHCLGNHDTDGASLDDTLALYRMKDGHYYFDEGGYRFIVCDTNYYFLDGAYIHYERGNYYAHRSLRDYMPPEQLEWLKETIAASSGPCVLISHASFERPDGVKNREEVQSIIREANRKRRHSVLLCINGHHHRDFIRVLDGVCYFDLNSASYDWIDNPHEHYPRALCEQIAYLKNTVVYNDPIHAIVTLEGTHITIEGMESSMLLNVRREDTPNPPLDGAARPATPTVQSVRLTLE